MVSRTRIHILYTIPLQTHLRSTTIDPKEGTIRVLLDHKQFSRLNYVATKHTYFIIRDIFYEENKFIKNITKSKIKKWMDFKSWGLIYDY